MNRTLYTGNPNDEDDNEKVLEGSFAGRRLIIQTTGDLTVSFWHEGIADYGDSEVLASPGGVINCPSGKMKLEGDVGVVVTSFGDLGWKHA